MTTVYVIGLIKNDYSVIDIFWPIGFLLLAYFLLDGNGSTAQILIKIFVTIWALRLSSFLFFRIVKHGPDKRYKELQAGWGKRHYVHAFFKVFMLQGAFMFLIGMPIITAKLVFVENKYFLFIGSLFWLLGFVLESVADWQLYFFKQKPENKGTYLMSGLYKYSRHPNYLGEILLWVGIAILAMPNAYMPLTILGPMVLTFALYKFSGVPYAERNHRGGAQFEHYVANTGAIFPKIGFESETKHP